jgi:hypothetical protein
MTDRLLEILRQSANRKGLALAKQESLVEQLDCDPEKLALAVEALESRGAITIRSPLPYLVAKVQSWSGNEKNSAETRVSPYSFGSSHSMNGSKNSYRDRPEGTGPLLQEVLSVLGENDPEPFQKAIELYAPHVIRMALDRVRKAQSIQKSRTALFRYLLPRIAKEHGPSSNHVQP